MKKKIYYILLLAVTMLLMGCQGKNSVSEEQYIKNNHIETETATELDMQSEEETLESTIELATHGCQVVQEGETMSLNGMNITVNDVMVTRKKGDWYDFLSQKLDEKGYLFENRAYVIVNVTIEQVEEVDFWLNSVWLAYFLDDNLRIGSIQLDGTSLFKEDDGNPDAFQGLIKKGETLTTDLIYVIKEEEEGAGAHFLLEYNPTGCGLDYVKPDKYGMIYLKSLEDVWNEIPMEE